MTVSPAGYSRRSSLKTVAIAMSDYKPSTRTLIIMLGSFFAAMLPAVWFAAIGYMCFMENTLKLDTNTEPEGIIDRLLILAAVLPMIPLMFLAIMVVGVPWMFAMSRVLSWADIEHFSKQKGPRLPFLSVWLDRLWLRMIKHRRPTSQPREHPLDSFTA